MWWDTNVRPTRCFLMERLKIDRCVDFLRCLSGRTIVFSGKRLYYQMSIAVYGFFDNIIACGWRCFVERFSKRQIRISLGLRPSAGPKAPGAKGPQAYTTSQMFLASSAKSKAQFK